MTREPSLADIERSMETVLSDLRQYRLRQQVEIEPLIPAVIPGEPPKPRTGILHQFSGRDNADKWTGPVNFPDPERGHNRKTTEPPVKFLKGRDASIKVEIKPGDPQWSKDLGKGPKRRAEFSWNKDEWRFANGEEGWVGAAFYLPKDPMGKVNGVSISQLHNHPDKGVLWNLFLYGGRLRSNNTRSSEEKTELLDVDVEPYLDQWVRMVVHFKPSTGEDGFIKMWLNDKTVTDMKGANKHSGEQGPYFKNGLYFWGYEKFDKTKHALAYFDSLSIGNKHSNYQSVDPKRW